MIQCKLKTVNSYETLVVELILFFKGSDFMDKLLEIGRRAIFVLRVISGYEERRIRSYRLQLQKQIEQARYIIHNFLFDRNWFSYCMQFKISNLVFNINAAKRKISFSALHYLQNMRNNFKHRYFVFSAVINLIFIMTIILRVN